MSEQNIFEASGEFPPAQCSVKRLKKALMADKESFGIGQTLVNMRGQEYHKHHTLAAEWVDILQGADRQAPFFKMQAVRHGIKKGLISPVIAMVESPVVPTVRQGSPHDRRHEIVAQGAWYISEELGHHSPDGWPEGWLWKTPGVRSRRNGKHGHYTLHVKYRHSGYYKFITNVNDSFPKTFKDPMQGITLGEKMFGKNFTAHIYSVEV